MAMPAFEKLSDALRRETNTARATLVNVSSDELHAMSAAIAFLHNPCDSWQFFRVRYKKYRFYGWLRTGLIPLTPSEGERERGGE